MQCAHTSPRAEVSLYPTEREDPVGADGGAEGAGWGGWGGGAAELEEKEPAKEQRRRCSTGCEG